jgi:hypothetical protein
MIERERLIGLVQRIMDGDYSTDEGVASRVAEFEAAVPLPRRFRPDLLAGG